MITPDRSPSRLGPQGRAVREVQNGNGPHDATRGVREMALDPLDPLELDALITDEERAIRDAAREWIERRVLPDVEDWYETGEFPAREIAKELGALGFLGMHLQGYGCLGVNAIAYGLAELELEAGDSGLRSMVSVQGALAMYG